MVRVMRFHSSLIENGHHRLDVGGVFPSPPAGPMPKSQLFWMGTLMRSATGFCNSLSQLGLLVRCCFVRATTGRSGCVGVVGERRVRGGFVLGA